VQAARTRVWDAYDMRLADWAAEHSVTTPTVPADCQHPAHLYYLLMPTSEHRTAMIDHLRSEGVSAAFHYVPLHDAPAGRRLGRTSGSCTVTTDVSNRLLRLPLFADQTDEQIECVVRAVHAYRF
jgi:dTDP-4-amino-4,6-dideoxygalactose transaminase